MKAIILAAGRATRLLPLTKDTPQCLLKIKNKPVLEHQIELLNKGGIQELVVITGYLSDKVEAFCKKRGIKTRFNPFYGVSGAALTLWVAQEELKNGFVFVYSDTLFDPIIIKGLLEHKADICFAIKKGGLRDEAERVVEQNGAINCISKVKITGENAEFIGIAAFSAAGAEKLIHELNDVAKSNIDSSFIDIIGRLINRKETIMAHDVQDAKFIDLDFLEDLKKAEKISFLV